jgi:uncharacterized protein (TIGR03067 family)
MMTLVVAFILAAPAAKDPPKPVPKLEGEWVVETMDGPFALPPGTVIWRFTESKVFVRGPKGVKPEEAQITVDLKKSPATIDFRLDQGLIPRTLLGIIEVDGDNMKLCWALDAGDRPTEFKPNKDKKVVLGTFNRVKPEK